MNRPLNRKERRMQKNKAAAKTPPQNGAPKVDPAKLQQAIAITLEKASRLLREEKYDEAAHLFIDVLQVEPQNTLARYNVGQILAKRDDLTKAAECFVKVLELTPNDHDCMLALARVRLRQDNLAETLALLEKLDKSRVPSVTLAKLYVALARFYLTDGNNEAAKNWVDKTLAIDPENVAACFEYGQMKKMTFDDPVAKTMLSLADKREALSIKHRETLCFGLARLYLNNKESEKAFAFFEEGNSLKKSTLEDRRARYEDNSRKAIRMVTPEKIVALKDVPPTTLSDMPVPVFIVGMPRSGSTLTDQILCSHPDVASIGESDLFIKALNLPKDKETIEALIKEHNDVALPVLEKMSPQDMRKAGDAYLSGLKEKADGKGFVINKMLFNYPFIMHILAMMPNAKIIHCTRDPADIGLSIWQLSFGDDMNWAYGQEDIAHYYHCYRSVMNHLEKNLPAGAVLEMNYETTVADQEGQTRRLLDFCGLPWDDACLRFYENDRRVTTASTGQVRQPMYSGSVRKWEKYENYLQPLLKALAAPPPDLS